MEAQEIEDAYTAGMIPAKTVLENAQAISILVGTAMFVAMAEAFKGKTGQELLATVTLNNPQRTSFMINSIHLLEPCKERCRILMQQLFEKNVDTVAMMKELEQEVEKSFNHGN